MSTNDDPPAEPPRQRQKRRRQRAGFGTIFSLIVAGIVFFVLFLSLSGRTIPVPEAVRTTIEERVNTRYAGSPFSLGGIRLGVGRDGIPQVVMDNIRIVDPDGGGVAYLNQLGANLSLDRLFQSDFEDGTLESLALSAYPLASIVIAKIAAHWATTGVPLVIISPVLAGMLGLPVSVWMWLGLMLVLGTLTASALGAVGAAVTMSVRRGGALLSLLVMPLFVPVLIFGVLACQRFGAGDAVGMPVALLGALTLFSLVLAPVVCAAAIRINLR